MGPADGGFVGFPARVLRVEDRVLRVEEEGRILVRRYPSRVKGERRKKEKELERVEVGVFVSFFFSKLELS